MAPGKSLDNELSHDEKAVAAVSQQLEKPTRNGIVKHEGDLDFDSIEDAISAFSRGSFVIVLDAPSRENEGDLICAAQDFTTEKAAFMIRHSSGLICCPVAPSIASGLSLPQMVAPGNNSEVDGTAYTISVDAVGEGMTTGISAQDRATTCRRLGSADARPEDFRRPGHVFPLRAKEDGIRARKGHTEATIELCRLAGKREVGAICELVVEGEEVAVDNGAEARAERTAPNGGMMRGEDCINFGRRWGIKACTIEALDNHLAGRQ